MSLRNRIVVAGLLMTLVAPAAGWAKMAQIDPDGQSLVSTEVSEPDSVAPTTLMERTIRQRTLERDPTTEPKPSFVSRLDQFFLWLRVVVQPY